MSQVGSRNDAKVVSMNAELRAQVIGLRAELGEKMAGVRAELGKEMGGVRTELSEKMDGVTHTLDAQGGERGGDRARGGGRGGDDGRQELRRCSRGRRGKQVVMVEAYTCIPKVRSIARARRAPLSAGPQRRPGP